MFVRHLAFDAKSSRLASASTEPIARVWDLSRSFHGADPVVADEPAHLQPTNPALRNIHTQRLLGHDPMQRRIVLKSADRLVLWEPAHLRPAEMHALPGGEKNVDDAVLSGDGRWLVASLTGNALRSWDLSQREPKPQDFPSPLAGMQTRVRRLDLNRDGSRLLVWSGTGPAWQLRMKDGKPQGEAEALKDLPQVSSVRLSDDGQLLALNEPGGTVRIVDLDTQKTRFTVATPRRDSVLGMFTPSGKIFIGSSIGNAGFAGILDLDDRAELAPRAATIRHGMFDVITTMSTTPNSRFFATTGTTLGFDVKVWDLEAKDPGASALSLKGHRGRISDTRFSPDNQLLATGAQDGTVRLWNLASAAPALDPIILRGQGSNFGRLEFSADGRWILAQGDKTHVWHRDLEVLLALARRVAGREFTAEERVLYLDEQPVVEARVEGGFF
jgi:WD40 repeat protein